MKIIASGNCGENVFYELTEDGLLTIFGVGDMYDYSYRDEKIPPFGNNTNIKKIVIKEGVTTIGNYVFVGCSSLVSVIMSDSVIKIGDWAFDRCISLVSILIPSSVKEIGMCALDETLWFYNQPKGCVYINDLLYKYAGVMPENTHIVVKEGIRKICSRAFCNCENLISIVIPDSVVSIGWSAFINCKSLESIILPNSVMEIEENAFLDCSSLLSVVLPNSINQLEESIFSGCSSLKSIVIPNSVINIGNRVFSGCISLESITIPNSVIEIGIAAFGSCESLKSIIIPNSVNKIKEGAFTLCNSLESIIIPNSVTEIESDTFHGCRSLLSVSIPNSVVKIGRAAFRACCSLEAIVLPNSVVEIAEEAFIHCYSLESITLSNLVTKIGYGVFKFCESLTSIIFPESVIEIGPSAFWSCKSLTLVVCLNSTPPIIPSVRSWDDFLNTDLNINYETCVLKIPKGSKQVYSEHIEWGKFKNIEEIEEQIEGECGADVVYLFDNKGILTIEGSGEISDDWIFRERVKVKSVIVGKEITYVGCGAFEECKRLRFVELGCAIEEIADRAFAGCENILSMTINSELPPIVGANTLEGVMRTTEIRVPKDSIHYYKAAKVWCEFSNYVAID